MLAWFKRLFGTNAKVHRAVVINVRVVDLVSTTSALTKAQIDTVRAELYRTGVRARLG